jgi:hypothetical protein
MGMLLIETVIGRYTHERGGKIDSDEKQVATSKAIRLNLGAGRFQGSRLVERGYCP